MKDGDKTKTELVKEPKSIKEDRENNVLNNTIESKQTERELKDSEERLKILFDYAPDAYYIVDLKGKFIDGNKAAERMVGYKKEELIGKSIFKLKLISISDMSKAAKLLVKNLRGLPTGPDEFVLNRKDNSKVTVESSTYPVKIKGKALVLGIARDITERKQAEEKLSETKEYLENLIKCANAPIIVWDTSLSITRFNRAFENLSGYDTSEVIGKKIDILFSKDKIESALEHIQKTSSGERWKTVEIEIRRKDGEPRIVLWNSANILDTEKKNIIATIVQGQDITERKQAEQALIESEEKYRTIFKNTGTATVILEENTVISTTNTQFEKLSGYSKNEIENKMKWTDFVIPEDLEKMKKYHIARRKAGEKVPTEYEFRFTDKKDNLRDIFLKVGIISGTKKSVASLMDITERRQAEEKIKHLNLVLRAIRSVNQLIVKEKNRERLLKGACNNLIETRGYYGAWIALLDKSGKLETYAEAGIGKVFLPIVEILKKGKLTVCGQKALKQQEVVTIKDPASTCPECPLVKQHSGRRAMTIRLEYSGKVYGFMSVSTPAHIADDQEEQSLLKEVAGDIAFGIHNIELDKERIQAEENMKKAKDELQMIMDSVPAIIFYKDLEGRIIRANKALADSLKVSLKDIIGKTKEDFLPKEEAENIRKYDREVIISGKPRTNIIESYDTPEGTRWAITDKIPYKDKNGKIIGVVNLSKDITIRIKTEQKLQQSYQKLKKTMDAALETMSKIIEAKDPYTAGHQQRVSELSIAIAKELHLSQDKIEGIRVASIIHDIGKIGLPSEILSKPSRLNDIEFSLIKRHSQMGYDILKTIDFSYPVAGIVLQHHERLNGSGYPNHLKGDEISLEARILGVADVVEAISSHRPYRAALGIEKALEEISQNKGILYDPEVVDACLKLFKEKGFKFES